MTSRFPASALWAILLALSPVLHPLSSQAPALLPAPTHASFTDDAFRLGDTVAIAIQPATPRMREIAGVLASSLQERGIATRLLSDPIIDRTILLRIASPVDGDESYQVVATAHGVLVEGRAEAGVLWGVQTLRQLLAPTDSGWTVHGAEIRDHPRYAWRGTMLDVGRHLFPVEYILEHLEWMSRYKLNVFHWHLTEDQGWRLQVDAYPRLTEVGAHRIEADGTRYGGFYAKADVRRVVERARLLGITVVPEIEMPGHSRAALAAYPHLGCTSDTLPVPSTWGVFADVLCPGKESTFAFLEGVLTEVLELFPSRYIHIGGDEVPKQRWEECEACQTIIRRERLGDEHGLQRWMIARIGRWLSERDRTLIGWDEVIDGGLPEGATVQAWQSSARIAEALALGADVIASPNEWVYLNTPADRLTMNRVAVFAPEQTGGSRPGATGRGPAPARAGRLLGAESPLWTEHVTSAVNAELMWWPRLLAFAEAVWHGPADTLEFAPRAERVARSMREEGVAVGPPDRALVALAFRYDSVLGGVQIAHQGIPGVRLALIAPGATHEVRDGDPLPEAGTWQLVATHEGGRIGEARTITVVDHLARGRTVRFATPADVRYPGTGPFTLTDGVRGTSFNDGFWNGWWGTDLDATIDLGGEQAIGSVTLSLLEQVNSWILYPEWVELHLRGRDGWHLVERRLLDPTVRPDAASRQTVTLSVPTGNRATAVRVVARGGRRLPAWHSGAGQPAWIFADEIVVESAPRGP